jgi:hypothetical protein
MAVNGLIVRHLDTRIDSSVQVIAPNDDIALLGGFALTGFIDVEKEIRFVQPLPGEGRLQHTWFLEKKLPFQVLVLDADPPEEEAPAE